MPGEGEGGLFGAGRRGVTDPEVGGGEPVGPFGEVVARFVDGEVAVGGGEREEGVRVRGLEGEGREGEERFGGERVDVFPAGGALGEVGIGGCGGRLEPKFARRVGADACDEGASEGRGPADLGYVRVVLVRLERRGGTHVGYLPVVGTPGVG